MEEPANHVPPGQGLALLLRVQVHEGRAVLWIHSTHIHTAIKRRAGNGGYSRKPLVGRGGLPVR